MKLWFVRALIDMRYSYWFIPSIMAFAAVVLAATLVSIDLYYVNDIPESLDWLFSSKPEGARAILSTVAGSTITVAGVVFSMTIMSVSHATANYGSRLLLKFLKDRSNQIALGTFTATFIYCLLVLRAVSNGESGAEAVDFVPQFALLGAIVLAITSVIVLIAFIHHVPDTIYIGNVAAERGIELSNRLVSVFEKEERESNTWVDIDQGPNVVSQVSIDKSGYVQTLQVDDLAKFCSKHSMRVEIVKEPGDFVINGEAIIRYIREPECDLKRPDEKLLSYIGIGSERTPAQDMRFLIEELQQIAIRALSPGINDPYTAIPCIDWLGGALAGVADKGARRARYKDQNDSLRVVIPEFNFERLSDFIFNDLRPHICTDLTSTLTTAALLKRLIKQIQNSKSRGVIQAHLTQFYETAMENFESKLDTEKLARAFNS